MMLTISPLLAGISVLCVPLSFVLTLMIAKRSQKQFAAQWKHTGELGGHVEEMFTGHNVVKVFGRQDEAVAIFDEQNEQLYEASFRAQFISGIIMPVMNFISNLNYVAICVVGGLGVASGTLLLGGVTGLHPVLAPIHDADHAGGQHHERAAVARRRRPSASSSCSTSPRKSPTRSCRSCSSTRAATSRSRTCRSATWPTRR